MPELSAARARIVVAFSLLSYLSTIVSLYFVAGLPAGMRGKAYVGAHLVLSLLCFIILKYSGKQRAGALWVLAAGVAARLLLLRLPAFTSNDVFRYLWDGWIAFQGQNPYRISPEAFVAARDAGAFRSIWPDNPSYPAIYPPLAMALFSLCARWGPEEGIGLWKLIVTAASLGTLAISWRWLKKRDALAYLALPALFPLLVLESGVGLHLDALVVPVLLLAFGAMGAKRDGRAGFLLGIAVLLKLYPLCLFPIFIVDKSKRRAAALLGAGTATILVGYAAAWASGWLGSGSLSAFLTGWSFGSPVGRLFEALTTPELARVFLWIGLAFAYGLFVFHRGGGDLEGRTMKALSLLWVFSPVVFPWYLLPLAATAALLRSPFALTWATLLPLTYEVLDAFDRGWGWDPAVWPLAVITAGWLLTGLPRARRSSHAKVVL